MIDDRYRTNQCFSGTLTIVINDDITSEHYTMQFNSTHHTLSLSVVRLTMGMKELLLIQ